MIRAIPLTSAAVLAFIGVVGAAPPGGRVDATVWDDGLVGAEACGACHAAQYADWQTTAHAHAYDTLSEADRLDPKCNGCHATAPRPGLEGVQCESCHGAGVHYWPDFVMRDKPLATALGLRPGNEPATCGRCHTDASPSILPFDFKRALPLVDHRPPGAS